MAKIGQRIVDAALEILEANPEGIRYFGWALFDSENPKDPQLAIRSRARYQQPDLFRANCYMKWIEAEMS
jgi:hypothetical protein